MGYRTPELPSPKNREDLRKAGVHHHRHPDRGRPFVLPAIAAAIVLVAQFD